MSGIDDFVTQHSCNDIQMEAVRLDKQRGTFKVKLKSIEYRDMSLSPKGTTLPMRVEYGFDILSGGALAGSEATLWVSYWSDSAAFHFVRGNVELWCGFNPDLPPQKLTAQFDQAVAKMVKAGPTDSPILGREAMVTVKDKPGKDRDGNLAVYSEITWGPVVEVSKDVVPF